MRRISRAFILAALLLTPSTALANQHRIRVSEILLSTGGDDTAQFIELSEEFMEGFPNTYYLGVYDADGGSLGTVSLPDPDPLTPGTILISTAAADDALGTNGEAELNVALPAAGQVCFEVVPSTKISCASWGCINTRIPGTGMYPNAEAAAPPDGMSAQLQGDGSFELAAPTPDAANDAGDAAAACATDPDAGPGGPDAGGGDADGGVDSPDGGGNGGDGSGDGGGDDDSGCGCRLDIASRGGGGLSFAAILLLVRRRRRRSR